MYKLILIAALLISSSFTHRAEIELQSSIFINSESLAPFYSQLADLENNKSGKVSIVHIGDSHIQADFLTGEVRKRLQSTFGNAGRGFVFPYKIARSGGALDVRFSYNGSWQYCDIIRKPEQCNIGVSGFTVTSSPTSRFTIDVISKAETQSAFTKITFFDNNGSFLPSKVSGHFQPIKENDQTVIYFDEPQDSLEFKPAYSNNTMPELQGMILENEQPGILYHAMGINGSTVSQYLRSNESEKQIAELNTNLVIISFGTNDAYKSGSKFCSSCIKDQYRELINRIRGRNSDLSILLTTPPDHFYQRKYSNQNVEKIRNSILELALEENVAVWDLYEIMGGRNSIISWKNDMLARRDLIHFTKDGYRMQGDMLYDALMHHYRN